MKRRRRLLDYYRQFEELSPEESSARYRRLSAEARSRALLVVPDLDLSSTAWHEAPHPEVVNAATYALRRSVNAYPDPTALATRTAIARHHGLPAERIVVSHGAGEILAAALAALGARGGEVVLPWPTWPPLAVLVARGGATPVAVPLRDDAIDLGAIDAAVRSETRAIVLAGPNDPTGLPLERAALRALLRGLPERVVVLVDEACAELLEPEASALGELAGAPRLVVVRSFAKGHAMAGFRVGWAAGGEGTADLLGMLAPSGSVGAAAQAGAIAALEVADRVLPRRRAAAAADRARLAAALAGTPVSFPAGAAAHYAWLRSEDHDARALGGHLAARRIAVAPGSAYRDDRGVRASLRGPAAVDRLADALREL